MAHTLATLATIAGVIATWLMLVLLLASAPNSKPRQWAQLKAAMWTVFIAGIVGLGGAIWSFIAGAPWPAAAFGGSPVVVVIGVFVVLLKIQG